MPGKQTRDSESCPEKPFQLTNFLVQGLVNSVQNNQEKLILRLFSETGITLKELINLRASDIGKDSIFVRGENTRGGIARTISIPTELSLQLLAHAPHEFVFSSRHTRQLREITVRKFLERLGKRHRVRLTSQELRKLFVRDSVEENGVEFAKDCAGLRRIDVKKFLTKEQCKEIRDNIEIPRDRAIFDLLRAGARLKEVSALKIRDVKNSTFESVKEISRGKGEDDYLFSSRQRIRLSEKRIFQIMKGYQVNPRILHNSYLAEMIDSGRTVKELQEKSGISSIGKFHLYGVFKHG